MAADTLDVVTYTEAKTSASVVGTGDAEFERLITAVSRRLDQACGAIVKRSITGEVHDGGGRFVRLDQRPISIVSSVVEYSYTTPTTLAEETNTAKSADDYSIDERIGFLYRRSGGCDATFPSGRKNVVVAYTAGRAANTAAVDPQFKEAAGLIIGHMWRNDQGGGSATYGAMDDMAPLPGVPGFLVPRAVVELLADELIGGPPLALGGRR